MSQNCKVLQSQNTNVNLSELGVSSGASNMDYFYFAISGFVVFIALMKQELLIEKGSFRTILLISITLFLIGLALHFTRTGQIPIHGSLLCPLITLAQYRLSRRVFLRYVKREPKDTAFVYSGAGLGKDRLFNLLYFIPAFWLLMLIPFIVEELAKAGW